MRSIDDIEWDLHAAFDNRNDAERALAEALQWCQVANKEVDKLSEELEKARKADDE